MHVARELSSSWNVCLRLHLPDSPSILPHVVFYLPLIWPHNLLILRLTLNEQPLTAAYS